MALSDCVTKRAGVPSVGSYSSPSHHASTWRSTEARQRAIARHKLQLIDRGGNWCLDCRSLAGTIETPRLKAWVEAHYEVVTVDVGRFDKNGQIAERYGIKGRLQGVPSVLVVEPRSNRLINQGHTAALADARSMSPQALADWLAGWVS